MDNGESQLTGDWSLLEDSKGGVPPPLVVPVIKLDSSDENGNSSEAQVCVFVRGGIYETFTCFSIWQQTVSAKADVFKEPRKTQ